MAATKDVSQVLTMYNEQLETDLATYSRTQDAELFNAKIYHPLSHLFKWLCEKQGRPLLESDFEDVQQEAITAVVRKMHYYKPNKGNSATTFARLILNQVLIEQKMALEKNGDRHLSFDLTMHDKASTDHNPNIIREHQELLEAYKKQIPFAYGRIVDALIASLTDANVCKLDYIDRIKWIEKQSKYSNAIVNRIIKGIKQAKLYQQL